MSYPSFKMPEITSAPATVATFATVSGFPGRSVASVAGVGRSSDSQTVAAVAAAASHPPNYGIWDAADLREMYEERAMEYDAGMSRAEAEAAAWTDVFWRPPYRPPENR